MRKGQTNAGSLTSERVRKAFGESSFNRILRQYKVNAKRRGYPFELSTDEFKVLIDGNCEYCGTTPSTLMQMKNGYGHYIYNGIDRVNSKLGYILTNCVSCCKLCNKSKTNVPFDDWIAWLDRIRDFRNVA